MDYGFVHQGKVFTPNQSEIDLDDVEAHNGKLERAELEAWSKAPDSFVVYVANRKVTTWRGTVLGAITEWSQFSTNISRNIVAIRFRGTNGAQYYGRFGADWSQMCRVRKARGQCEPSRAWRGT